MQRQNFIVLLFLALATACSSAPTDSEWHPLNPGAGLSSRSCGEGGPNTYYFPSGALDDGYGGDAFSRQWYSAPLTVMGEPSLSCGETPADEAYRFLWLRSFDQPIAVRIFRKDARYELSAVILSGAAGYPPGKVVRRVHRSLTQSEWDTAIGALSHLGFWFLSAEPDPNYAEIGLDGAQWIIEGRRERYHVVDRWNGDDGVRDAGLVFLALAGITVRRVY